MKKAVIFDVDGTLADVEHRKHWLTAGPDGTTDWPGFFSEMHKDPYIQPIVTLLRALYEYSRHPLAEIEAILIVTARPDTLDYIAVTMKWFEGGGIKFDASYTRADEDRRPDPIVKEELLMKIVEDGYDPILVIDDRPEVVAMWRSHGIITLQCQPDEIPPSKLYYGQNLIKLLVGPSGAGKTTHCLKNYKPHDIISSDAIREQYGKGQTPDDHAWVFRYMRNLIRARLDSGIFTVVDSTNLRQKDRLKLMAVVPPGITATYVLIDRDYEDKIETRGWRPVELIDKHHAQMKTAVQQIKKDADGLGNVMIEDVRIGRR